MIYPKKLRFLTRKVKIKAFNSLACFTTYRSLLEGKKMFMALAAPFLDSCLFGYPGWEVRFWI